MSDSYHLQGTSEDESHEIYTPHSTEEEINTGVILQDTESLARVEPIVAQTDENGRPVDESGKHELYYKPIEKSLHQLSGRETPNRESPVQKPLIHDTTIRQFPVRDSSICGSPLQSSSPRSCLMRVSPPQSKQLLSQGYPDTDSCLSVSPSPDPDSKIKTFDFSMIDTGTDGSNLSAALQMEQEFLDFMFSLPQIQKEAKAKEQQQLKRGPAVPRPTQKVLEETSEKSKSEKRSVGNASRAGLDHLDNLCRMMEQLGELKEQNTRLQRRVHYLEELKALQEMHRDVEDSIAARKSALSLGSVSLSDSDLRLEDLNKSCAYLLDSEESLDQSISSGAKAKGQVLELPNSSIHLQLHSSSEDDRRPKHDPQRVPDKEKKAHKSAWGKVKNMINYNSKRESIRKKSGRGVAGSGKAPPLTKSFSVTSTKITQPPLVEEAGISDPEEYDLEYESMDQDGTSWEWEGDGETGIWMGPKCTPNSESLEASITDASVLTSGENLASVPKKKPQLTITLPSGENLHHTPAVNQRLSADFKSHGLSKGENKRNSDVCMTPPSPRRSSNWSKVKQAFLTGPAPTQQDLTLQQDHPQLRNFHSDSHNQIQPHPSSTHCPLLSSTPHNRKKPLETNFSFDGGGQEESDSPPGISPEISPNDLILKCHQKSSKAHPRAGHETSSRHGSLPSSVVHKNLIELQKTLTGEFSKKLQEWEKFRGQGIYSGGIEGGRDSGYASKTNFHHSGENLPQEFRKKLHEWEKMKNRDKYKHGRSSEGARYVGHSGHASHHLLPLHHHHQQSMVQGDLKTKKHDEDDLPPDFKKKLTEWEIRKALAGKGQQNVEKLQKNLGEEFNKKMAEWEKMKALGLQGKINPQSGPDSTGITQLSSQVTPPTSPERSLQMVEGSRTSSGPATVIGLREPQQQQQVRIGSRISPFTSGTGVILPQSALDRKGSAHKVKKNKPPKTEKPPLIKPEGGQKNRDKELLWLEKELNKIDREKQRLEREKEKFLEREARLEKMRYAMRQGPAEKREIYIKTSTGEFRFEGISQTFTKKLYEWEERRGIRPESSTFVLLDPNYKAPVRQEQSANTHQSPETKRITRSRSESSLAEIGQPGPISSLISHQSSLSLSEEKEDAPSIQADKTSSEPTLVQDDLSEGSKCTTIHAPIEVLPVVKTESIEGGGENSTDLVPVKADGKHRKGSLAYQDPYAPLEITRLIDSSGSEEKHHIEAECPGGAERRAVAAQQAFETETDKLLDTNAQMSEENYRSLLHENMTLLGKLKEQENLCRALETQMGDIDSKMDNVADQHLKTLEKLHRQVTMMQRSESLSRTGQPQVEGDSSEEVVETETNERLIEQLKARIVELEIKGEKLMAEKEELECAFKLHKDHETQIAESLLIRIRELQDAGAEVNIQTVQCQTDEALNPEESQENSDESKLWKEEKGLAVVPLPTNSSQAISTTKKKRRKRRDDYNKTSDDEAYDEDKEESDDEIRRSDKEGKEQQKRKKKVPPKKVQKLHNLTADLLFQAKRLEGALVTKHHLPGTSRGSGGGSPPRLLPKRSLRGRSSLRLGKDEAKGRAQRKPPKGSGPSRTWSSIEAIVSPEEAPKAEDSFPWETRAATLASESQDLLAMNAELSRMARELRKEMMSVWSFRESTSPDSNSSDGGDDTLKTTLARGTLGVGEAQERTTTPTMQPEQRDHWLDDEATVVFHNISSLQPLDSEDSKNAVSESAEISDSETGYKTPSPTFKIDGEIEPSRIFDDPLDDFTGQPMVESEEHFLSWWDVPFPKKRKDSLKPTVQEEPQEVKLEDIYPDHVEPPDSVDYEVVLPGCSKTRLVDLLHNNENEEVNEENETLQSFRLSPYYNITSPRASRFSRASSTTSEEERKDSFDGSAFGTLKTNASSTFKSDVLSSSFEYENTEKSTSYEHLPHQNVANGEDSLHLEYPSSKKSTFTPSQLHKVGQIIEETVLTMKGAKIRIEERNAEEKAEFDHRCDLDQSKYETEVTAKVAQEDRGLRTRRVSDTQVEYEAQTQKSCSLHQCLGDVHKGTSPQSRRTVVRAPSVRRNQSESDVSWLHHEVNPYPQHQNKETPPDVFVTTHRTIFTISGEENSLPTRVIPTFLQDDTNGQHPSHFGAYNQSSSSNLSENSTLSKGESNSYSPDTPEDGKPLVEGLIEPPYTAIPDGNGQEGYSFQDLKEIQHSTKLSPYPPTFLDALSSPYHALNQPLESRRKVLEAANETNPTVKTMIDLYNKRITEKQELLINPFKPGDPFTENKGQGISIENIPRNPKIKTKDDRNDRRKSDSKVNISKSQSASILQNPLLIDNFLLRKSSSGTPEPERKTQILEPSSAPVKFFGEVPIPFTLNEHSQPSYYSKLEGPFELDVSTEDSTGTLSDYSSSHLPRERDTEKTRAVKIREAKEEFLARGSTPSATRKRLSGEFSFTEFPDPTKAIRGTSVPSPSSTSGSLDSRNSSFRRAEGRQTSVRSKDSFRRQSESVIMCEQTDMQKNVVKSASSGFIELRKKPPQGLPPSNKENRKSCYDASDVKRNSKGIFKIFKLSRGKERKDLSAVQKLCQHSLDIEIASTSNPSTSSKSTDSHRPREPQRTTESAKPTKPHRSLESCRMIESSKPTDAQRPIEPHRPTELQPSASSRTAATSPASQENSRCSRTLPRDLQANSAEGAGSSSVSCPSSPVGLRKSRTAQWLAKGKKIFKSRSPSPNKRPR